MKSSHCLKYKVVTFSLGQNFSIFLIHILGNATTSYFCSEISWPLGIVKKSIQDFKIRCWKSKFSMFENLPSFHFKRYKKILWNIGQILATFVPPDLKLHNLYCHNLDLRWCFVFCAMWLQRSRSDLNQKWPNFTHLNLDNRSFLNSSLTRATED